MYLAQFQVRILLGSPSREKQRQEGGREYVVRSWECGCAGMEITRARFWIIPCGDHAQTLPFIEEDDERSHYDSLVRGGSAPFDYSKTFRSG